MCTRNGLIPKPFFLIVYSIGKRKKLVANISKFFFPAKQYYIIQVKKSKLKLETLFFARVPW